MIKKMKLKDIGTIVTGNTPSKKNEKYYNSNDINFFTPKDFEDGKINNLKESVNYISNNAKEKARILPKGSVLVTCIGIIGKVGITQKVSAFNQQINAVIPNADMIDSRYLAYWLMAKAEYLRKKANAPVVPIINKTDFQELTIDVPDMKMQKEIVSKLNKIQKLIDIKEEQKCLYGDLIKSQFIEIFGDPMENPKNNKIVNLSEIAEYWNGLTYKPTDVNKAGTIVLRASNIQNSQLDYQNIVKVNCNIKDKQYVKENDILMCSRNGSAKLVGKVAVIKNAKEKMTFGAFMMIIRSEYYPYLFSYFQTDAFRNQIKSGATTTINQITRNMLSRIKLPLPHRKDIEQFAEIVKQIDKQKEKTQKSLEEIKKIQENLMNQYFNA